MKPAAAILLALSFLAAGCASSSKPTSGQLSARDAATGDVLETAFRYQIEHNPSASRYCLELAGTSPSAEFVRRFEGNQPPVLSAGQCESQAGKGLYLRLTKIEWIVDDEVWVRGATSEGDHSFPIEAYRVVREKGKWSVKAVRAHGF
jgi:hypothetical protein